MTPSNDRTHPENHPYIDRHSRNPHERDFNPDHSAENPFWFPEDADSTRTAWRYMDLAKFISILQNDSLWFSHHSNFEDPYDGKYSEITAEEIRSDYNDLGLSVPDHIDEGGTLRFENYVSCWNIKNEQSVALWNMYFEGEVGVAIKTTVDNLTSSVDPEIELPYGFNFMPGMVVYRSVEDEPRGYYGPIFSKRPIFDFENEYRLVFTTSRSQFEGYAEDRPELPKSGIPVSVDVESLIDEVYISPMSGGYVKDVVEDLKDDLGYEFDVEKSKLFTHPNVGEE